MGGFGASLSAGRVQSGEYDQIILPRVQRPNRYPVVLCHGAQGSTLNATQPAALPGQFTLAEALWATGVSGINADWGGASTWGNDTTVTRVEAGRVLMGSYGCDNSKVVLVGISMGFLTAMSYARAHPTRVAGLVGVVPVTNPVDIYSNNRNGFRTEIGTAWGVTYPTPLPTRANPSDAANLAITAGLPCRLYYSTADTICLPSLLDSFASALPATKVVIDTSAGHTDGVIGLASGSEIGSYARSWGA